MGLGAVPVGGSGGCAFTVGSRWRSGAEGGCVGEGVEAEASYGTAHGNLDVGAVATYGLHHLPAL